MWSGLLHLQAVCQQSMLVNADAAQPCPGVQSSDPAPEAHTAGASGSDAAPASALSYMDILRTWVVMGWIGFGGPAAHIALFQKVCTSVGPFCGVLFEVWQGLWEALSGSAASGQQLCTCCILQELVGWRVLRNHSVWLSLTVLFSEQQVSHTDPSCSLPRSGILPSGVRGEAEVADLHSLPGAAGAVPVHAGADLHSGVLCPGGHAEGDTWRPADRCLLCTKHLHIHTYILHVDLYILHVSKGAGQQTCWQMPWVQCHMQTEGNRCHQGLMLGAALLDSSVTFWAGLGPHVVPDHRNVPDCTPWSLHLMHFNTMSGLCSPAGLLFQYPGLLLAGLVGVGAANWLKSPAPWLKAVTSGGEATASALPHAPVPPPSCCCHHPVTSLDIWPLHLHLGVLLR